MKSLFPLFLILFIACGSPSSKTSEVNNDTSLIKDYPDEGYLFSITSIDNRVNILVDDSLVFDSETIGGGQKVNFEVPITAFLKRGDEVVKIQLYNGIPPYNPQFDQEWKIAYDFVIDGEIVDFAHESGSDGKVGVVFENTYKIEEW